MADCPHGLMEGTCDMCAKDPQTIIDREKGPVFAARYEGRCGKCDERIYVGDDICLFMGVYVHEPCAF